MTYQFEQEEEIMCCADCPMAEDRGEGFALVWHCVLNFVDIEDITDKPDWCPLVEVESEDT